MSLFSSSKTAFVQVFCGKVAGDFIIFQKVFFHTQKENFVKNLWNSYEKLFRLVQMHFNFLFSQLLSGFKNIHITFNSTNVLTFLFLNVFDSSQLIFMWKMRGIFRIFRIFLKNRKYIYSASFRVDKFSQIFHIFI